MPLPAAVAGGLISGGGQILGGVLNAASNARQNRKSRTFARGMYQMQHNDAIKFWKMQNSYNDPSAQMQRLREAGVNPVTPFLKGGGIASGNAGALNAPKVVDPLFNPTDYSNISGGITNAVNSMYDLRIKQNTANNLAAQNDLMVDQAKLIAAQTYKTLTDGKTGDLNYKLQHELYETNLQAAKEALRNATIDADYKLEQKEQFAALWPTRANAEIAKLNLTKAQERQVNRMTKNLAKTGQMQDFELMLNQIGLTKSDSRFWRILGIWKNSVQEKVKYHMDRANAKLKR